MSFPFRRRSSSPRTPEEYSNGSTSPGRIIPLWKVSMSRRGPPDIRRLIQLLGIVVIAIVLIALAMGMFPEPESSRDPFLVDRSPTRNFFDDFEGDLDCHLSSRDLYLPPILEDAKKDIHWPYCHNRETLLRALNGGGRYGFDEPYVPHGCHYKWYTSLEICIILERFDGLLFVGDDLVAGVYAAFNMLLRQNIALGGLEQWRMEESTLAQCRCAKQYTNPECSKYFVTSSAEVAKRDSEGGPRSPYVCNRAPHWYFPIAGKATQAQTNQFRSILAQDPHSWKPVPVIHSLGLSTGFNWQSATESMDEWLMIADASGRNTPFIWLGPNAAGHLKPPSRIMQEGNNALWHYSLMMATEAKRRYVDVLNSYNLTLQASSWDGSGYDSRVSLVQAMMLINWLAKLETT